MTLCGIIENLVSDVIFLVLAIGAAWGVTAFTQRRLLLRFFSTTRVKRLPIYLSNIYVQKWGSLGISGERLSYQGKTVAHGEVEGADNIRKQFTFIIPRLAELSERIGSVLLSDVRVPILISPRSPNALESVASFICLGGPAFNVASQYAEQLGDCMARCTPGPEDDSGKASAEPRQGARDATSYSNYTQTTVIRPVIATDDTKGTAVPYRAPSSSDGELLTGMADQDALGPPAIVRDGKAPITDPYCGFVQRIRDDGRGRYIFYVAGLSEFSTKASACYLASHWRALYQTYGAERSFLVLLKFDKHDPTKWTVVPT